MDDDGFVDKCIARKIDSISEAAIIAKCTQFTNLLGILDFIWSAVRACRVFYQQVWKSLTKPLPLGEPNNTPTKMALKILMDISSISIRVLGTLLKG